MKANFNNQWRKLEDEMATNMEALMNNLKKCAELEKEEQEYNEAILKKMEEKKKINDEIRKKREATNKKLEERKSPKHPNPFTIAIKKHEESKPKKLDLPSPTNPDAPSTQETQEPPKTPIASQQRPKIAQSVFKKVIFDNRKKTSPDSIHIKMTNTFDNSVELEEEDDDDSAPWFNSSRSERLSPINKKKSTDDYFE